LRPRHSGRRRDDPIQIWRRRGASRSSGLRECAFDCNLGFAQPEADPATQQPARCRVSSPVDEGGFSCWLVQFLPLSSPYSPTNPNSVIRKLAALLRTTLSTSAPRYSERRCFLIEPCYGWRRAAQHDRVRSIQHTCHPGPPGWVAFFVPSPGQWQLSTANCSKGAVAGELSPVFEAFLFGARLRQHCTARVVASICL